MWIYLDYEDLVCSQESGAMPSHFHHILKQSHTAKKTDTANQSFSQECPTGLFPKLRSGMTSDISRETCCPKELISSTEEVLVSNYQTITPWVAVWREKIASYSLNSQGWLKRFDPVSFSWKMSRGLSASHCQKYARNFPSSGIVLNGLLFQLPEWELLTSGDGGSCLRYPTLMKTDATAGAVLCNDDTYFKRKNSWRKINRKGTEGSLSLARYVQLIDQNGELMPQPTTGKLNPKWLEWFMGFPINWTQLKHLEMR
jgi:hypothetical protein